MFRSDNKFIIEISSKSNSKAKKAPATKLENKPISKQEKQKLFETKSNPQKHPKTSDLGLKNNLIFEITSSNISSDNESSNVVSISKSIKNAMIEAPSAKLGRDPEAAQKSKGHLPSPLKICNDPRKDKKKSFEEAMDEYIKKLEIDLELKKINRQKLVLCKKTPKNAFQVGEAFYVEQRKIDDLSKNIDMKAMDKKKFERLQYIWGANARKISKVFLQNRSFWDFAKFSAIRNNNAAQVRLGLNKLEYMLYYTLENQSRKHLCMSLYEFFVIYLFSANATSLEVTGKSDVAGSSAELLSTYLKRTVKNVRSNGDVLKCNLKAEDAEILFKQLVPKMILDYSQELEFNFVAMRLKYVKIRSVGAVRFSFFIDLYLLDLYQQNGIVYFVDDLRFVVNIFHYLKNNRQMDFLREFTSTQSKSEIQAKIDHFFGSLEIQMFIKYKFENVFAEFENLILSRNLIKKVDLNGNVKMTKDQVQDEPKKLSPRLRRKCLFIIKNPKRGEKREKVKEPVEAKRVHVKQESARRSFLTKRARFSRKPADETQNSGNRIVKKRFLAVEGTSDVVFYNFGVDYLKSRFNFAKIKIEELSHNEKLILKHIVRNLLNDQDTECLGDLIYQMLTSNSSSIKEYMRNIDLFYEYFNRLREQYIPADLKFNVIQILYKIREMNRFLTKTFFKEEASGKKSGVAIKSGFQTKTESYIL